MTGLLRQERQRIYQPSPLSSTAAPGELFKSTDFEDIGDGPPEPRFEHVSAKEIAAVRSASVTRSALFKTNRRSGTCLETVSTKASSSPAIGGSAPITTMAASMCGMNACVAAVFPRKYGAETRRIHEAHAFRKQRAGYKYL
jgi:hypothetical protein